jgi:Cysteine-rich secretory protein family
MDDRAPGARSTDRTAPVPPAKPMLLAVLALGVFLALPFASVREPALEASAAFHVPDNECWTYRRSERLFGRLMNIARENAGLRRLSLDPEASKVARKHSREMVEKDLLHHTPSSTLVHRVTRWEILGENVGVGSTVDSLHHAFMDSPPHRANVLHAKFRHVGIGVTRSNERMWVTVILENRLDPGTRLRMPRC